MYSESDFSVLNSKRVVGKDDRKENSSNYTN